MWLGKIAKQNKWVGKTSSHIFVKRCLSHPLRRASVSLRGPKAFVSFCQMPSNASQSRYLLPKKLVCFRSQDGSNDGADYVDPQFLIFFANQRTCQTLRRVHRGARNWPKERKTSTHTFLTINIRYLRNLRNHRTQSHTFNTITLNMHFPSCFPEGSRCDFEGVSYNIETCYLE